MLDADVQDADQEDGAEDVADEDHGDPEFVWPAEFGHFVKVAVTYSEWGLCGLDRTGLLRGLGIERDR